MVCIIHEMLADVHLIFSGFHSTIFLRQEQHVIIIQPMWLVQSYFRTCTTQIY